MPTNLMRFFTAALIALLLTSASLAQEVAEAQATVEARKSTVQKKQAKPAGKKRRGNSAAKAKKRAASLRAIMAKLDIGAGSTVADIGAGSGRDSWVFADVVGTTGKVYSEEITEKMVRSLRKEAAKRNVSQVEAVLGKNDDPGLPVASADMAFMHYVYHHFSQPREMLAGLWRSLKPGGFLVIVDRHLGTLQDWVPREVRAKKHYWLAETTVVREAREAGFAYVGSAEDCWPADDQFVLMFQRPVDATEPGSDPDQPLPLDLESLRQRIASVPASFDHPVFVALGPARQLIVPILQHSTGPGLDVVLEEWATQKDERPELLATVASLPSVLTEKGEVELGEDPIGALFFMDTYHLLFHQEKLLAALHSKLAPNGRVYVLDRIAKTPLSRRESSHRRMIPIETVKREMAAAGFRFVSSEPAPAKDRMLLVFAKQDTSSRP